MIFGYARVSTDDQNLDAHTDALLAAGAECNFSDKITGLVRKRPQLDTLLDLPPGGFNRSSQQHRSYPV